MHDNCICSVVIVLPFVALSLEHSGHSFAFAHRSASGRECRVDLSWTGAVPRAWAVKRSGAHCACSEAHRRAGSGEAEERTATRATEVKRTGAWVEAGWSSARGAGGWAGERTARSGTLSRIPVFNFQGMLSFWFVPLFQVVHGFVCTWSMLEPCSSRGSLASNMSSKCRRKPCQASSSTATSNYGMCLRGSTTIVSRQHVGTHR